MYTQSLDPPGQLGADALVQPSFNQTSFDAVMKADGKIEPQDWMPEAYRKTLIRQIDEVAFACAAMWSDCYCGTVSVGNIRFRRPSLVGHVVELHARVVATGRASMHIHVSVCAGDPKTGELELTTDCLMVFVAVDADGQTTPVPSFTASSHEERRLAKYAMDVKAALDALVELKPDEAVAGRV